MKRFILASSVLIAFSCKTSSREDMGVQMTDISVKLPENLSLYESKVAFSRTDSLAKPKIVKGTDIKVKLPSGNYTVDLTLTDKTGVEIYRSCEIEKSYSFSSPKQDAIISICRSSDRALVWQTLATIVSTPVEIKNPIPEGKDPPVTPGKDDGTGGTGKPDEPKKPEVEEAPLFVEDRLCFGLPATYSRDGNVLIIKMTGSIKDHIFDLTNSPRCSILFNISKSAGQGFSPLNYSLTFSADQEVLKQNFYVVSTVKDENGLQALPCRSMLLNSAANSGANYPCSFYDTTEANFGNVLERNRTPYANSCAAESKQVKFDFFLNGAVDKLLKEMTLSELRIQMPIPEKCLKSTN